METLLHINPNTLEIISLCIAVMASMIIKDVMSNAVQGFMFYMDKQFNEGDTVFLNNDMWMIVKIGIKKTTFQKTNGNVEWLFINNDRIKFLHITKVVKHGAVYKPDRRKIDKGADGA